MRYGRKCGWKPWFPGSPFQVSLSDRRFGLLAISKAQTCTGPNVSNRKRIRKRLVRPSAGINRHAIGNERVLQERSSEPPGFVSCGVSREAAAEAWARGISGLGIELREDKFGAPTPWTEGEGHTAAGAKSRARCGSRVVVDPRHAEKLHAREPGDLIVGCQ
jgi:hypothetical protein